ncbi:MAG: ankyrin repeat domain-containing protein [Alphaproteobacteria bacterium]|nr:ankyrin repeat domain-containing protein [Alphaproteobacteria bacterium]
MIQAGADVNARNAEGKTALIWAARNNYSAAVTDTLIKAGSDITVVDVKK